MSDYWWSAFCKRLCNIQVKLFSGYKMPAICNDCLMGLIVSLILAGIWEADRENKGMEAHVAVPNIKSQVFETLQQGWISPRVLQQLWFNEWHFCFPQISSSYLDLHAQREIWTACKRRSKSGRLVLDAGYSSPCAGRPDHTNSLSGSTTMMELV